MKRYLVPILPILVLASLLLGGCSNPERDKALTFYKGAHPIAKEMKQISNDWNAFLEQFSQRKVSNQEILRTSQEYATRFERLSKDLSMLYAPLPLRQLKDDMSSAINQGIEAFALYKTGAEVYSITYFQKADQKMLECNRLMMRIADEWDDGLAHYKIEPSEIQP